MKGRSPPVVMSKRNVNSPRGTGVNHKSVKYIRGGSFGSNFSQSMSGNSYNSGNGSFKKFDSLEEPGEYGGSTPPKSDESNLASSLGELPKKHSMSTQEKFRDFGTYIRPDLEDLSPVFGLRGYYSEACLRKAVDKLIPELKTGSLLKQRCASMEDLILCSDDYKDLVTGNLDEVDFRQYEISNKMMTEWRNLFELEKDRFSFFDELMAMGYVVDSLEVPGIPDNLTYLVEADQSALRSKVDYGRVVFKTKHVYMGNFNNWYFEGPGRYSWINGTTYQGDFKNGVMHGEGVLLWTDGSIYEGQFLNGIRAGWGVYSTSEGYTYAGDWYQGLPHSKGKMWYDPENDEGDYYDGNWSQGRPNGQGARQYKSGDRYVGEWKSGVRNGVGTMTWLKEAQVYKGDWKDGVPHGEGRHTWYLPRTLNSPYPTRHIYQGSWENGLRHGIGRMIYPCGSIYEGRWLHGQRHGKGIFVNPAGNVVVGLFRLGTILGGVDVPLHRPTYECNFPKLVEALAAKYGFTLYGDSGLTPELMEENLLSDTTIRFLDKIKKLYKRAGLLGESWGNTGLYPKWMKNRRTSHGIQLKERGRRRRLNVEEKTDYSNITTNANDKFEHETPDNVHPVTRFGLWLLMRDCPGILPDVTTAEYDRIFNMMPSISFETSHNPFEPVYLWQFLQCLVVIACTIYVDVPRRNEMLQFGAVAPSGYRFSLVASEDWDLETMRKGQPKLSTESETLPDDQPKLKQNDFEDDYNRYRLRFKISDKDEKSLRVMRELLDNSETEIGGIHRIQDVEDISEHNTIGINDAFEKLIVEKLIPYLEGVPGENLPPIPNPLPSLGDLYNSFCTIHNGQELITGVEFFRNLLPHIVACPTSNQDPIFWTRSQEILSPSIDLDIILNFFAPAMFTRDTTAEAEIIGEDFLGDHVGDTQVFTQKGREEIYNSFKGKKRASVFIYGLGNKVFGIDPQTVDRQTTTAEKKKTETTGAAEEDENEADEFLMESTLFSERDLLPTPFLWTQDARCISIPRKEQSFSNLKSKDVIRVLRQLFPRACGKPKQTNLEFDMTFCDWLFGTSMAAKISSDREFHHALKKESLIEHRPFSRRCTSNRASVYMCPGRKLVKENRDEKNQQVFTSTSEAVTVSVIAEPPDNLEIIDADETPASTVLL